MFKGKRTTKSHGHATTFQHFGQRRGPFFPRGTHTLPHPGHFFAGTVTGAAACFIGKSIVRLLAIVKENLTLRSGTPPSTTPAPRPP